MTSQFHWHYAPTASSFVFQHLKLYLSLQSVFVSFYTKFKKKSSWTGVHVLSCCVRRLPNTFNYAIVCLYSVGPSWLQNKIFGHGPTFWWWSRPGTQYLTIQFYLIKLLNRELMLLTYYVWIHFNWWWCWRRGQYWGWPRMPDITHVKQAFSFFYSFHISHLKKKKTSNLFFFDHHPEQKNLILSVLKLDRQAAHAFEMTYTEWKSTDPL